LLQEKIGQSYKFPSQIASFNMYILNFSFLSHRIFIESTLSRKPMYLLPTGWYG